MKNIAIIGCGGVGRKRALACGPQKVRALFDIDPSKSAKLGEELGIECSADVESLFANPQIEIVIVATTHRDLAPVAVSALSAGKHVFVEKPGALNLAAWETVAKAAEASGKLVRVGFNHRFHPALQKAKALVDDGSLGPLFLVRGRYGHGGRLDYEKEWRADPSLSGGGELLDQGVHLIDLSAWFLGRFESVDGHLASYFWKMPVEDNAFVHLRASGGAAAWLHASWTEWKNLFSFEIYGSKGKLHVEGLGGSYGIEKLSYYPMRPEMGPPVPEVFDFNGPDLSWRTEIDLFLEDIAQGRAPVPGIAETREVLRVVQEIYSREGRGCSA